MQAHYRALLAVVVPTSGGSYIPENKLISHKPTTPYTKSPNHKPSENNSRKGKNPKLTEEALLFLFSTFIPIPLCPSIPTQITFPLPRILIPVLIFSVTDGDGDVFALSAAAPELSVELR